MEKRLDFILDETKFYMTCIQKNYRHTSNLQNVLTKQEYTYKLSFVEVDGGVQGHTSCQSV